MTRTLTAGQVAVGAALPELSIDLTPTVVVSTALATMDFTPVHHDVEGARAQGSKDIFLNILTTMGLLERYVTDWAGPEAVIRRIDVKLGAPAYAGDVLAFTGRVASAAAGEVTIEVRGQVSLGDHATGTVALTLPTETVPAATVPTESIPTESIPTETVPTETVPAGTVPAGTGPGDELSANVLPADQE